MPSTTSLNWGTVSKPRRWHSSQMRRSAMLICASAWWLILSRGVPCSMPYSLRRLLALPTTPPVRAL
ncbi:hypothetical protein D9M68_978600 [compost metagenome]